MEIGVKTIIAGAGLFLLGVGTTYWLMADSGKRSTAKTTTAAQYQPAMQAALSQLQSSKANIDSSAATSAEAPAANTSAVDNSATLTHESFLAEAEARREQQFIDKAEVERMEKLRKQKVNSVECKFWQQQQKTASAAAKIEEKIVQFCMLAGDAGASSSAGSEPLQGLNSEV